MEKKTPVTALQKEIQIEGVKDTYNGRPGCACGCRGSYKDSSQAKTLAVRRFQTLPESAEVMEHRNADGKLEFVAWDNPEGTRTYTIYTRNYMIGSK